MDLFRGTRYRYHFIGGGLLLLQEISGIYVESSVFHPRIHGFQTVARLRG